MNYTIRKAEQSDSSGLLQLIRNHAAFEKSVASLKEADLASMLCKDKAVRFLVAAEEQTLLGYAAVTFDWSVWRGNRYAHLDCLFVAAAHRGGGIGRQLLAEAKAIAVVEGVDRMEWQTPTWNEPAIRFYRREGADRQYKARFVMTLI